jgi:hypothetical protein
MAVAQRQKRIGDILLLTEEIKNPLIKEEAIGEAGNALRTSASTRTMLKRQPWHGSRRPASQVNPATFQL